MLQLVPCMRVTRATETDGKRMVLSSVRNELFRSGVLHLQHRPAKNPSCRQAGRQSLTIPSTLSPLHLLVAVKLATSNAVVQTSGIFRETLKAAL